MRILLIEDDPKLSESLRFQLEKENFSVDSCSDGDEGLYYIKENSHDLVLLDRMLPSLDGLKILKEARNSGINTPVIFITALGETEDKVDGLDQGADDYLVKPFEFSELMARIRCIFRRPKQLCSADVLEFGDISYDVSNNLFSHGSDSCSLANREGQLLEFLMRSRGRTLSRDTIISHVWGTESDIENGNLDNYIYFLRRRLNTLGSDISIQTVRGIGYRLEAPDV